MTSENIIHAAVQIGEGRLYLADLMEHDVDQETTTPPGEGRKEDLKRKGDDIKTPKLPEREFEALGRRGSTGSTRPLGLARSTS